MKRLLLVALLLCVSASAQMWPFPGPGAPTVAAPPAGSFAVVHEYDVVGSTTSGANTVSITSTTAGNALIFILASNNDRDHTISGVTATKWFRVLPTSGVSLQVHYALNISSGITSVSMTPVGGTDKITGKILEVSGLATSNAADVYATPARAGFGGGNASAITGSVTTTNASDVIFGIAAFTSAVETFTAGTGYTLLNTVLNGTTVAVGVEYKTVSATGAYNPGMTWTPNNNLSVSTIAFKLQ